MSIALRAGFVPVYRIVPVRTPAVPGSTLKYAGVAAGLAAGLDVACGCCSFVAVPEQPLAVLSVLCRPTLDQPVEPSLHLVSEAPRLRDARVLGGLLERAYLAEVVAATGASRVLVAESSKTFVELTLERYLGPLNWAVANGGNDIIWFSERDGWGHLYRYDGRGNLASAYNTWLHEFCRLCFPERTDPAVRLGGSGKELTAIHSSAQLGPFLHNLCLC